MRFHRANARIDQLVNDPLIAEDVQLYAEQRSKDQRAREEDVDDHTRGGPDGQG